MMESETFVYENSKGSLNPICSTHYTEESFFETVVRLLGTFLFVKTSRAMGLDLGTIYLSIYLLGVGLLVE
jgi:hypothetical protein